MNKPDHFSEMKFNRLRFPRKAIAVLVTVITYIFLWRQINPNTFFWIGLVTISISVWLASYSWKRALVSVIYFLQRLENLWRLS